MACLDPQGRFIAISLQIEATNEFAVEQKGQDVITELAFGRRSVDLDAVFEPEGPLDARSAPDE